MCILPSVELAYQPEAVEAPTVGAVPWVENMPPPVPPPTAGAVPTNTCPVELNAWAVVVSPVKASSFTTQVDALQLAPEAVDPDGMTAIIPSVEGVPPETVR